METLQGITLQEFWDCLEQYKTCLDQCLDSNGEYFEGDKSVECKNQRI